MEEEKLFERLARIEARQFTQEEKREILVGISRIPEIDKNCKERTTELKKEYEKDFEQLKIENEKKIKEIKENQKKNIEDIAKNKLSITRILAWATGAGSGAGLLAGIVFKLLVG